MNPIGWCDKTRNYVRGCLNDCSYCYARRFNKRTWKKMFELEKKYRLENDDKLFENYSLVDLYYNMRDFKPVFMYSQFAKLLPKKPMRIFMDSMSDIAYWKPEWIGKTIDKIKKYPQHQFLFLSKNPKIYLSWNFFNNCWMGITITTQNEFDKYKHEGWYSNKNYIFISIEPILEKIKIDKNYNKYDWIIVGADSSLNKNKIIPKKEWIEDIRQFCQDNNIPYFEKDNLKSILNRDLIQQFPEDVKLQLKA